MEAIIPWLTPALIVALGAWLRGDMRTQGAETNRRIDDTTKRIDERVDNVLLADRRQGRER